MAAVRRRRRRRSRRGDLSPRDLAIGGGLAVTVLVLLVVAGRFTVFAPKPPDRDPETGCPEAGPAALTAILIDVTDQIGAISRADVLAHLDEYVAGSREDEMVLAYEAKPVGSEIGDPLLSVCHPGDPDEASEWTENPRLIRRRLEERFEQPLDHLFAELLGRDAAPTSPLMESVQSVAVSVLGRHEYTNLPKRLILVSDLMQNTRNLSFFRQAVDYGAFAATAGGDALRTDLRGTAVEVLFVQRTAHERLDGTRGLIDFWQQWIEDQGGTLNRVVRVDGVN
ncbi:MAG: hypothetical protein F4X59_09995 [Holophagales bacterium]|nr:hypothetical protein [Holophagales bacterium]MYC10447.1 hypothetical protein [Holophagales bacterium]